MGDAGFSSRNPAVKGKKVVTFTLANGQADDYPLASTYPVEDGFRALATFIDTGRVPDDIGWRNEPEATQVRASPDAGSATSPASSFLAPKRNVDRADARAPSADVAARSHASMVEGGLAAAEIGFPPPTVRGGRGE